MLLETPKLVLGGAAERPEQFDGFSPVTFRVPQKPKTKKRMASELDHWLELYRFRMFPTLEQQRIGIHEWNDMRHLLGRKPIPSFHGPVEIEAHDFGFSGVEMVQGQEASGTIFDTYTTAKTVINAQALYVIRQNFWNLRRTIRINAWGGMTTLVTTPGLVAMQVMQGTTGTIVAFTTGNIQINATAHTLLPWWFQAYLTCQVIGSGTTAKTMGMGTLQGIMFTLVAAQVDSGNVGGIYSAPATAPAQGTGFDSTIANILDFWVGFTISSASNRVQVQIYTAEVMN